MAQLDELIPKSYVDNLKAFNDEANKLNETYMKLLVNNDKIASGLNSANQSFTVLKKTQSDLGEQTKKLTDAEKEAERISKEQAKTLEALDKQRQRAYQQMAKDEAKEKELAAAIKKEATTIEELNKQNRALIEARKKVNISTEEGKRKIQEINAQLDINNAKIKANASALEKQKIGIGSYSSALKGFGRSILSAIGLTSGILLLVNAIRNMFNISKEFEQQQSNLAAVLGKTKDETKEMAKSAVELGRSTVYSAREVTGLQTELAKLGFTQDQILLTSRAVLDFAAATNASLPEAAKVTGVALRAFNLSMEQAEDAVATLAIGTARSALSFADFETMLSTVGPIANAFGFTLEDTTALMGKLKDAGFDASTGATALRNILLNLADSNGLLAKRLGAPVRTLPDLVAGLEKLKNEGVDLNDTLQLTDKRSVAAFNTFLNGSGTLLELKGQITGVKDELQGMVATQLDNMAGDMKLLSSAWEGFVLSVQTGDGPVNKFIRGTLQALANMLTTISGAFKSVDTIIQESRDNSLTEAMKGDIEEMNTIAQSLINNGVPALDAYARAKELLRLQFVREKAEVWDNAEAVAEWDKRIENLLNTQTEGESKLAKVKEEKVAKTEAEIAAEKKALDERLKMQHDIYIATTTSDEEAYKIYIENLKKKEEAEKSFLEQLAEFQDEEEVMDDALHQKKLEQIEEEKQAAIDAENEKIKKRQDAVNAVAEAGQQILDITMWMLDAEMGRLEQQKAYELELAGDNAERRAAIEERYDKRMAELKTKQAKADKAAAIFKAIINIAQSITAMLSAGPVGIILSALAAAIGAVQLGVIASQPIPKFFTGTDSAPDGVISVGEKGRELIKTKSGQLLLANEPTLAAGLKGARIFSNRETEAMLRQGAFGYDSKELQQTLERNNDRLIKTIQNKKEIHINTSKREITEREGGYFRTYKNRYFK